MHCTDEFWTRVDFIYALRQQLPDVAAAIMDISEGLLHCEMSDFARCTHEAIHDRRFYIVQQHLQFVAEARARASTDLANAILGSYLENVFIGESTPDFLLARELLSPLLRRDLAELELYWARCGLPGRELTNPFHTPAQAPLPSKLLY